GGDGGGGAIPPSWQALDTDIGVDAGHGDQRLPHHRIGPLPVRRMDARRARLLHREIPDVEAALKVPKSIEQLPSSSQTTAKPEKPRDKVVLSGSATNCSERSTRKPT